MKDLQGQTLDKEQIIKILDEEIFNLKKCVSEAEHDIKLGKEVERNMGEKVAFKTAVITLQRVKNRLGV